MVAESPAELLPTERRATRWDLDHSVSAAELEHVRDIMRRLTAVAGSGAKTDGG